MKPDADPWIGDGTCSHHHSVWFGGDETTCPHCKLERDLAACEAKVAELTQAVLGQDGIAPRLSQEREVAMEMVAALSGQIEALNRDAVRKQEENARLRALLREVEWLEGFDSDGDEVIECPLCHAQQSSYGKYRSHTSDCRLAAALEGR